MENPLDSSLLDVKPQEKWTSSDRIGLYMAGISFAAGTLILLSYLISKQEFLISLGMIYLAIAFFVNVLFFLVLVIKFIFEKAHKGSHILTAMIMLTNIPIAYGYFLVVIGNGTF